MLVCGCHLSESARGGGVDGAAARVALQGCNVSQKRLGVLHGCRVSLVQLRKLHGCRGDCLVAAVDRINQTGNTGIDQIWSEIDWAGNTAIDQIWGDIDWAGNNGTDWGEIDWAGNTGTD